MSKDIIKLLHVEDDEIDRRSVKRILAECSRPVEFTVESVSRISAAIEYLANSQCDIILLDLGLPDSSGGIEGVQKLVSAVNSDLPIVVLTGEHDEETGLSAIKNGATDYLCKDLPLDVLLVRTILYALERKKTENKLKETMNIKSQFISTVSHELRTPLTAIKEGIAIILDGMAGQINNEQKDLLDIAKRNADRLARLINDVLNFQKLDAGKIKFDKQKNDMNEVIREVHKTIASSVKERAIDFCLKLEDNLPKVEFDSDKIIQVLTNLLGNAVKFTEKGSIAITTSKGENTILVSVSDTGRGIKKEDLPRLFHEFEQLTEGRERKTGGTGLGLVIAKEIIRQHGGKIWAESECNKGTTFHFVLPIEERRKIWRKES